MADSNQAIEWYLARDGRQHGPVTDVELKKIIELGYLRPTDLVWRQGMVEWALAEKVLDLPTSAAKPSRPEPVRPASSARPASYARMEPEHVAPHLQGRGHPSREMPGARDHHHASSTYAAERGPASHHVGARLETRAVASSSSGGAAIPAPARVVSPDREGSKPSAGGEGRRHGFPWRTAIVVILASGLAGGALALHRTGKLYTLPFLAAPSEPDSLPVVSRPSVPSRDEVAQPAVTVQPSGAAQGPDTEVLKSPLWQRLKRDFPDWYQERAAELSRMSSENKTEREINSATIRWLVELRRRHNADALAASPARLKSIAASFVESLAQLARESTAACYGYISQGEASPVVANLRKPEQRAALDVQLATIFDAVAEGRKSPMKRDPPRREDYDALSGELGKRGWSAADLQLFTDARALSRAAPEKVCQMVQDWFAAQLAIEDEAVKTRLLGEALKPVVAG